MQKCYQIYKFVGLVLGRIITLIRVCVSKKLLQNRVVNSNESHNTLYIYCPRDNYCFAVEWFPVFLKITQKAFGVREREASILNFSWGKSAFCTNQTITWQMNTNSMLRQDYHTYFLDSTVYVGEVFDCEQKDSGYVSLDSLSSIDSEPAFETKRKYKPGAMLYQL